MSDWTEVHVDCPDELWVQADRVRVDQMLGNLLPNAKDFSSKLVEAYSQAEGSAASGSGPGLYVCFSLPLTPASA